MSEAGEYIRQGCQAMPTQAFASWGNSDRHTACVIGAGAYAYYHTHEAEQVGQFNWDAAVTLFLDTMKLRYQDAFCPVCDHGAFGPTNLIVICYHLNDHHTWTRERIAEWLDSQLDTAQE